MMKFISSIVLLLLLFGGAAAETPKSLVGRYQMEVQGGDILELRADGSASLAGDETRWTATENVLTVGPDAMTYQLIDGHLILNMGNVRLRWRKLGGVSKGASPMQRQADRAKVVQPETTAEQAAPQDVEASRMLMSSAWCSFTYNKNTGASTTRRVVFRPDGVITINGGAETYSSGYGGTYAGQSKSGQSMRWKLQNLRLYIDEGNGAGFQDINLTADKNSNGWPILHAEGREYSMCK